MEEIEVHAEEKRTRKPLSIIVFIVIAVTIGFILHRYVSFVSLSRKPIVLVGDTAPL